MLVVRPNPDGTFTELPPYDVAVTRNGVDVVIPWMNFAVWTSADSRPYGLYVVMTPQAPMGKTRTGYTFKWNADKSDVLYVPTYEDAPNPIIQILADVISTVLPKP